MDVNISTFLSNSELQEYPRMNASKLAPFILVVKTAID